MANRVRESALTRAEFWRLAGRFCAPYGARGLHGAALLPHS